MQSELGTVYDEEDFEDESNGDLQTTDGDWSCWTRPGYGDLADLFPGTSLLQQGVPCSTDPSCVWAFINGSTTNYGCAGFPAQATIPRGNTFGQYIHNEVWSPLVPWTGTGSAAEVAFDVYSELPLSEVVFYTWKVRSWIGGCPGRWQNDIFYYDNRKQWFRFVYPIGALVETGAEYIQVSLGVVDMCELWCGLYGSGLCHSHTPLFDNVEVYRYSTSGPAWSNASSRRGVSSFCRP